jgi:hypothetical protein
VVASHAQLLHPRGRQLHQHKAISSIVMEEPATPSLAPDVGAAGGSGADALGAPPLTLDECREAFYVAARACERYTAQLKSFVELLDSKKAQADEAWIEAVQEEAKRALFFHSNQHAEWDAFTERADSYVDSVRRLAEAMAIAGALKMACGRVAWAGAGGAGRGEASRPNAGEGWQVPGGRVRATSWALRGACASIAPLTPGVDPGPPMRDPHPTCLPRRAEGGDPGGGEEGAAAHMVPCRAPCLTPRGRPAALGPARECGAPLAPPATGGRRGSRPVQRPRTSGCVRTPLLLPARQLPLHSNHDPFCITHAAPHAQAELPENKARTVHPELLKFKLEKRAR